MFARAGTSGFIDAFDVYVDKRTIIHLGISGDIVLMLEYLLPPSRSFKVSFDSWFTSYGLLCVLKERGPLSVGTVQPNRLPICSFKNDGILKKEGRGSFDVTTEPKKNVTDIQ